MKKREFLPRVLGVFCLMGTFLPAAFAQDASALLGTWKLTQVSCGGSKTVVSDPGPTLDFPGSTTLAISNGTFAVSMSVVENGTAVAVNVLGNYAVDGSTIRFSNQVVLAAGQKTSMPDDQSTIGFEDGDLVLTTQPDGAQNSLCPDQAEKDTYIKVI